MFARWYASSGLYETKLYDVQLDSSHHVTLSKRRMEYVHRDSAAFDYLRMPCISLPNILQAAPRMDAESKLT